MCINGVNHLVIPEYSRHYFALHYITYFPASFEYFPSSSYFTCFVYLFRVRAQGSKTRIIVKNVKLKTEMCGGASDPPMHNICTTKYKRQGIAAYFRTLYSLQNILLFSAFWENQNISDISKYRLREWGSRGR